MAFHDVRLPASVELGAIGGPKFKTTVFATEGGHEQRNIDWEESKGEWDIAYSIREQTDLDTVIAFFRARFARAHGFRFKDWSDFTLARQSIGTGNGVQTAFQIFKRYSSGGSDYDRDLLKIVSGTASIWKNGILQSSGFTINHATGIVTFSVAPTSGHAIEAACEFDVPVRFDIDHLRVRADFPADGNVPARGSVPAIPLVELRADEA